MALGVGDLVSALYRYFPFTTTSSSVLIGEAGFAAARRYPD